MKKTYYLMVFIICSFLGTTTFSFEGNSPADNPKNNIQNDSLLFDGSGSFSSVSDYSTRYCKVIVKYIEGTADGEVEHTMVAGKLPSRSLLRSQKSLPQE